MASLINMVNKYPVLSKEELLALIAKYQQDVTNKKLGEKIILHNLRFAMKRARAWTSPLCYTASFPKSAQCVARTLQTLV